jgi:SAM-dependent methyltransferase
MDEIVLENYFGNNDKGWKQHDRWKTRKTGQKLLDKISDIQDLSPEIPLKILDVGCGNNDWKQHLGAKLTGIDPFNSKADFKISINDYYELQRTKLGLEQFDIILALGSINFGDHVEIEKQVWKVVQLLKPGGSIYWRFNPGITHANPQAQWIDFFPWSEDFIKELATRLKCTVVEISEDHEEKGSNNRLYSEWTKNIGFN